MFNRYKLDYNPIRSSKNGFLTVQRIALEYDLNQKWYLHFHVQLLNQFNSKSFEARWKVSINRKFFPIMYYSPAKSNRMRIKILFLLEHRQTRDSCLFLFIHTKWTIAGYQSLAIFRFIFISLCQPKWTLDGHSLK